MSDEESRQRVVARVVSTLDPRVVEFFTYSTATTDVVQKKVSPPRRRHRRHGWCESADTLAAFFLPWAAREDARQFLLAHPSDRTAWKTLRSACANLQEVIAEDCICSKSTSPKPNDSLANNDQTEGISQAPEKYGGIGRD